jgi:LmbE family N-acetylglucosaminyl deacetylase
MIWEETLNILAIGAHFDDIELGCAGSLAMHARQGDEVYAYVATVSGFKNYNNELIRDNEIAFQEGKKAMETLGVQLICGNFNTFEVEFSEPLNIEIVQIIEEKKIDRVYTHWYGDIHHDHHAVSKSSLHSCRHVPRILMYRSNWYQSCLDFRGNYYIDITDFMNIKEDAIKAHTSELERTRYAWLTFFRNEAENAGQRIGVKHAEIFEIVKWLEN